MYCNSMSLQCFNLLRVHRYIIKRNIKNQNYRIIFLIVKKFISISLNLFWIKVLFLRHIFLNYYFRYIINYIYISFSKYIYIK